jgi:hypothetical protein
MKYSQGFFSVSGVLKDWYTVQTSGLDVSGLASFADKCTHNVQITKYDQIVPLLAGFACDSVPTDIRNFLLLKCAEFCGRRSIGTSEDQSMRSLADHVVSRLSFKMITEPALYAAFDADEKTIHRVTRTSSRYRQYRNAIEEFYPQLFEAYCK